MRAPKYIAVVAFLLVAITSVSQDTSQKTNPAGPAIPKTWDDAAMAALEVPLANPIGSPKHVPADYYYRIPVRPIYKSYPVYAPGHEPPGYLDWLKQQEPIIVWDDGDHKPPLLAEADWLKAGEIVFDSPISYNVLATVTDVRDPVWYQKTGTPVAEDGTMQLSRYVIRKKGVIDLGEVSCASCHTRLMPDGSILKGAQGNISAPHELAYRIRAAVAKSDVRALEGIRANANGFYAVPESSRPKALERRAARRCNGPASPDRVAFQTE